MRLLRSTAACALTAAVTACNRGSLGPNSIVVTAIPHALAVTAEPALSPDSTDWLVITPLHLETGRVNLEVTNRSGQDVHVDWGGARLIGLDGEKRGLDVYNLKLDARGELPVPGKLPPYSAVQVRMTADAPRFPRTVPDSSAAQTLCMTLGAREILLTLPAQRGREKRVYTVHMRSDVHVAMGAAGGSTASNGFDCPKASEPDRQDAT